MAAARAAGDEAVARDGEAAGLDVVMDRCLKIEHARFHGGLHLAGFDTGVITSAARGHPLTGPRLARVSRADHAVDESGHHT